MSFMSKVTPRGVRECSLYNTAFRLCRPSIMQPDCTEGLRELLAWRILVLDGAMGTMIQHHGLGEAGYRGERFADWPSELKGNNDLLACLLYTSPSPRDSL